MAIPEKKESAVANDIRLVSAPHDCKGGCVGLYASADGTVDLTTPMGTVITGVPMAAYGILPIQVQSVEATTVALLYELVQA